MRVLFQTPAPLTSLFQMDPSVRVETGQLIEPLPDVAPKRQPTPGAEAGSDHLDSKHFVDLARGMGIPASDAARQVMDLIDSFSDRSGFSDRAGTE